MEDEEENTLLREKYDLLWMTNSFKYSILTHCSRENPKMGTQANSADPDQTPHNAASDQGLHCLLTAIFVLNQINLKKYTLYPLSSKWTLPIYKSGKVHPTTMG